MKPLVFLAVLAGFSLAQSSSGLREFPLTGPISASLPLGGGQQVQLSLRPGQKVLQVQIGQARQDLRVGSLVEGFEPPGAILAGDLNFDGWLDLALPESSGYGGVVYYYTVYAYNPPSKRFVKLDFPGDNSPYLSNPQVNPGSRTLESAFKSGPAWFTNSFRFEAGKPYLYQKASMFSLAGVVEDEVLWHEQTFDPGGRLRSSRVGDGESNKAPIRTLSLERLSFYTQPNEGSRTNAYIIKGDRFEVLDLRNQGNQYWVKIAYQSRAAGRMERWVKLPVEFP